MAARTIIFSAAILVQSLLDAEPAVIAEEPSGFKKLNSTNDREHYSPVNALLSLRKILDENSDRLIAQNREAALNGAINFDDASGIEGAVALYHRNSTSELWLAWWQSKSRNTRFIIGSLLLVSDTYDNANFHYWKMKTSSDRFNPTEAFERKEELASIASASKEVVNILRKSRIKFPFTTKERLDYFAEQGFTHPDWTPPDSEE